MKPIFAVILTTLIVNFVSSQLNCKTKTDETGSTKTCYHKNGKPSTIEFWDSKQREGNMKGYNTEGQELFNYGLRSFAGHASVYLSYYPNGQVKKAEYSSMPDGGIQSYRYIHEFDELGNQTQYMDLSMPDGHPTLHVQMDTSGFRTKQKIEKKQEVVECATPYVTVYELVNDTKKPVKITMKAQWNMWVQLKDTTFTLQPKQTLVTDSVILANIFLIQDQGYLPELVTSKNKKPKFNIFLAQPLEAKTRKVYSWHVVGK